MNSSDLSPVSSFCRSVNCNFSERFEIKDGHHVLWLTKIFLTFSPPRTTAFEITRVARNVPLGVLKKCFYFSKWIDLRWPSWLVIGQDIFYFFSRTTVCDVIDFARNVFMMVVLQYFQSEQFQIQDVRSGFLFALLFSSTCSAELLHAYCKSPDLPEMFQ